MTLGKVIVDLGPVEYCSGLTYTALSRCKKSSDLAIDPFPDLKRFERMQKKKGFLDKLKEDKKILLYEIETLKSDKL